jgi:very-short-patch-repair endonuclease
MDVLRDEKNFCIIQRVNRNSFDTRGWRSDPGRWSELKAEARRMRQEPTAAEQRLWQLLRGGSLGARFRCQHAIGQFIVDFYCATASLVIELDGSSHKGRSDEDAARQEWLEANGLTVLRFSNDDVLLRPEEVVDRIVAELDLTP